MYYYYHTVHVYEFSKELQKREDEEGKDPVSKMAKYVILVYLPSIFEDINKQATVVV